MAQAIGKLSCWGGLAVGYTKGRAVLLLIILQGAARHNGPNLFCMFVDELGGPKKVYLLDPAMLLPIG